MRPAKTIFTIVSGKDANKPEQQVDGDREGWIREACPYPDCAEHVGQLDGDSPLEPAGGEVRAKCDGVVARRGLEAVWSKFAEPMDKNRMRDARLSPERFRSEV